MEIWYSSNFDNWSQLRYLHALFLDMASKLYSLSQSSRKYQIEDIGCQIYVACEAAKFDRENSKNSFNGLIDDVQGILK